MDIAIDIKKISKRYKNVCALDELSLLVPTGKVYGLLGENGAGKTTTLRIVTGLIKPNCGHVKIFGDLVNTRKTAAAKSVGSIIESPGLYGNLTAKENLKIAAKLHKTDEKKAMKLLNTVGLHDTGKKRVKNFSTGMKQRLGIACAMVHSPKILILDEPTIGLDPQGVIDLRNLINKLAKEMHMTVVVSSHILAEIEQIADLVGIIHKGKLIEQFDIMDLADEGEAQPKPGLLEKRFLAAVEGEKGERQ